MSWLNQIKKFKTAIINDISTDLNGAWKSWKYDFEIKFDPKVPPSGPTVWMGSKGQGKILKFDRQVLEFGRQSSFSLLG